MTGDSILLIGIAERKINLDRIIEYEKYIDIETDFGENDPFTENWDLLKNTFGAEKVFILNLDSWNDLKNQDDFLQQEDITYVVPLGLYLSDSYDDIFTGQRYYYSQLLAWMLHNTNSTLILTGVHASGFTTLTEYLEHEKEELDTVKNSFSNLRKQNVIYVGNCLNAYSYANVVLAGMLLGDVGEYPTSTNLYASVFDIDWCDVPFDMVFFKNNYLIDTSVENLMNFSEDPFFKPVTVDRIVKYIARHWVDMSQYIGTAYTDYKMTKIYELADNYLQSLVGYILYQYEIVSITSVQNPDSTVSIHIKYNIWPHFTTEKFSDEVIL